MKHKHSWYYCFQEEQWLCKECSMYLYRDYSEYDSQNRCYVFLGPSVTCACCESSFWKKVTDYPDAMLAWIYETYIDGSHYEKVSFLEKRPEIWERITKNNLYHCDPPRKRHVQS